MQDIFKNVEKNSDDENEDDVSDDDDDEDYDIEEMLRVHKKKGGKIIGNILFP